MKHVAIFDNLTGKRLAFLQNAYKVSYSLEYNTLWLAEFTMPFDDPKNQYCKYFNRVEIWDGDRYIGLFRIIPIDSERNDSDRSITYTCEHVLATLIDDVMQGWHQIGNIGVHTPRVLQYIIDHQTTPRWILGECDFQRQYLYGWENENLLAALFSVPRPFTEDFRWEFDTRSTPWVLSLKRPPNEVLTDLRYKKNMKGVQKRIDPTQLCTRLYPFGYGEGVNELNIAELNNGKLYIDADSQSEYGVIARVWKDARYQDRQSLFDAATAMSEKLSKPFFSYRVSGVHDGPLFNAMPGDLIRVVDNEDNLDMCVRIVGIDKKDVYGAKSTARIMIANSPQDIAGSLADMADRQRIEAVYSQGSTSLFADSFYDNCSPQRPARIRFFVPDNAVHINKVMLDVRVAPFRSFSQATAGGGGGGVTIPTTNNQSTSTVNNDQQTTSTQAQAVQATTQAQGHNAQSFGAQHLPGNLTSNGSNLVFPPWTTVVEGHSHQLQQHFHVVDVAAHGHTVTIPGHGHTVPGHSHGFTIPGHSHNFNIPDHTHQITPGIFEGTTASAMTLMIGNTVVGHYGTTIDNVNLVPFLPTGGGGRIRRGWHTIEIIPNNITRVECNISVQLFANSRGGGQF